MNIFLKLIFPKKKEVTVKVNHIKQILTFTILITLLLTPVTCKNDEKPQDNSPTYYVPPFQQNELPLETNVWSINLVEGTFYLTTVSKVHTGNSCVVYVEKGQEAVVGKDNYSHIAANFDDVYTKITENFAPSSDVDNNGKVILILLDVKDGYVTGSSQGYVGGFFYSYNSLSPEEIDPSFRTNHADILYIDTNPAIMQSEQSDPSEPLKLIFMTVVHEFQHLCNFNQNQLLEVPGNDQAKWIDEGLAECAAHFYFKKPLTDTRIRFFNEIGTSCNSFSSGHVSLVDWNKNTDDSCLQFGDYAISYLFFLYLWSQTGTPDDCSIFKDVINNSDEGFTGLSNVIQAKLSNDIVQVYENFLIANVLQHDSGKYGYNWALTWENDYGHTVTEKLYPPSLEGISSAQLKPFSFIYLNYQKPITEVSPTDYGSNIRYVGIPGNQTTDFDAPYNVTSTLFKPGTLIAWNSSKSFSEGNYPTQSSGPGVVSNVSSHSLYYSQYHKSESEKPYRIHINPNDLIDYLRKNN